MKVAPHWGHAVTWDEPPPVAAATPIVAAVWACSGLRMLALGCDQGVQAVAILGTGRTALEMRLHARDLSISITAGELQLDVAVEVLEALVARQLRFCRSE